MKKLFILREQSHFDRMVSAIRQNWAAAALEGTPLGVRVSPYKQSRSDEQNALMWVWLGQIAQDAWIAGKQFGAEVWHEHCKQAFYPDENSRGDKKWRELPDGSMQCVGSTTRLDAQEMSDYMNKLAAFAANELGVELK